MTVKIIRTITGFGRRPDTAVFDRVAALATLFTEQGYAIQTQRACFAEGSYADLNRLPGVDGFLVSLGRRSRAALRDEFDAFCALPQANGHLDITAAVTPADVDFLFQLIEHAPGKTFTFAYASHVPPGSPFFPAAAYARDGFAIGLQTTNLAADCSTLGEWLAAMERAWTAILALVGDVADFHGLDASVAPLYEGESSLVHQVRRLAGGWETAVTSDFFTTITDHLSTRNPRPVGLNGLMFPCLEDFELARLYEDGLFTIERNLFLALHSGLGIDTYPIGIDEDPARVYAILRLLRALSVKYQKPLLARFVSDGQAKIGQKTDFGNQYLRNVVIRPL